MARLAAIAGIAGALLLGQAAFPVQSGAEELKVAMIYSLTGPYAFAGAEAAKAAQLGFDEMNAAKRFGNNTVKLITYDDASDKQQTLVLMNKAVRSDNAIMVLGPTGSVQALVAGPAANDLKIPLLTNANTAEVLKPGPWGFKVSATSPDPIIPVAAYATNKLKAKRVGMVYLRDNEGMVSFAKAFRDYVSAHGATIVVDQTIIGSESDFGAVSTKLVEAKIDTLYLGTSAEQAANIVVQAKQAGVADKINIVGSAGLGTIYVKVGGKAVEGTLSYADYDPNLNTELNKKFVAAYKKRFNEDVTNWAGLGYSAALLAGQAIATAGALPTRDSVREALAKMNGVAVVIGSGKWTQDANRNPDYGMRVMQIRDGVLVSAPE